MNIFNKLYLQLARYWTKATVLGRFVTIGSGLLMVATVAGTAIWSSMPDYKLLREGIPPALAGEMVSLLDSNGIPNRLNYSGTGIMVPTSRWNQANIAVSGLSGGEEMQAASEGSNNWFPSQNGFGDNVRQKELLLERSISSLRAIASSDVHLAVPEPSPFRKDRSPTSASVIIEPRAGSAISQEVGATIIHMVASAVEGLDPKNVTLTSSEGTMIGNAANNDPASIRRDFVRTIEVEKAVKAQDILAASLGMGKSIVRVTAVVDDFLDRTITQNKILADDKVPLMEKLITKDEKGGTSGAGGAAGTAANGGGAAGAGGANGNPTSKKEETAETTYDYPRTVETTREVGGQLTKLSVSAAVDVTVETDDGSGTPVVTSVLTQQQVEELIKTAVGFDQARGDQIQVVLTEIPDNPMDALATAIPESEKWAFVTDLARHASLGLAAVVALLIGTMTLKKMKPIEVGESPNDRRRQELLSELSKRVDQNPEAVSKILAAWMSQENEPSDAPTVAMSKAA